MTNVTDLSEARDKKKQKEINNIWELANETGNVYRPSLEDDFYCLRLRDMVERKVRAAGLISEQFGNNEIETRKLSVEYPAQEYSDDLLQQVSDAIAKEIIDLNKPIGYICKILTSGPVDMGGRPQATRVMMIRLKSHRAD